MNTCRSLRGILFILKIALVVYSLNGRSLYSQIDTIKQSDKKPKIIFEKDSIISTGQIEMLSSEQFMYNNKIYSFGEKGENLKRVMVDNPDAVKMVENAYNKRSTGTTLMVIGGAVAVAGYILPSTWVKLDEQKNETYVQTWYWLPGVTVGLVMGGIGYVQYSDLNGKLREAIDFYNKSKSMKNE